MKCSWIGPRYRFTLAPGTSEREVNNTSLDLFSDVVDAVDDVDDDDDNDDEHILPPSIAFELDLLKVILVCGVNSG